MIESALREVGAARSIVIDEAGTVLAGNATIEAAAAAGIERVQIVDADGETLVAVRRRGLSDEQKTRLALYDNRTAELAEWDSGALTRLAEENAALLNGLFTNDELTKAAQAGASGGAGAQMGDYAYRIIVECCDERHQAEVLGQLEQQGLTCRALVS